MSFTSKHLYILDDDIEYAHLLEACVIDCKDISVSAHSSAISFLSCELPEQFVLILDLAMPEMDGIEVIRELSTRSLDVSFILISGFDERVLHSASQLAEAHGMHVLKCFTKPVDIHLFKRLIPQVLQLENQVKLLKQDNKISEDFLKEAIQSEFFVLHYQPQVELLTGRLLGFEVLARIDHPEFGLLMPDTFIHIAEENGLMELLTERVISIVCKDIETHRQAFENLTISLNISYQNIYSLNFPETLLAITDRHHVNPSQLNLELTESEVMGELTSALDVLNRLRMKGFSLSIDDFGTGFSSLTQLYNAPFSELKIDRHFVSKMEVDNEARVIVEICTMLGKMLGMRVVAEGVESVSIMNVLKELGCSIAQGYVLSKPKALNEILLWNFDQGY